MAEARGLYGGFGKQFVHCRRDAGFIPLQEGVWQDQPTKSTQGAKKGALLVDDADGSATLEFLKAVKKSVSLIAGTDSRSLGLDPVMYFYGATGRFQPTAFLATVSFVRELEQQNRFFEFTTARKRSEDFLLQYRHFSNQVGRNYGSGVRGLNPILTMYHLMLSEIKAGTEDIGIVQQLQAQQQLRFLRELTDEGRKYGRNFSTENKTAAFLREAMQSELRCTTSFKRLV